MADIVSTGSATPVDTRNNGVLYSFPYSILPQYAAWNAATNYSIGARVTRSGTGRFYEALVGGVDATNPEDALGGDTPKWADKGPTPAPVYLMPDIAEYGFSGFASLHLVQTAGQVTIQLQSDNSLTDANFVTGYADVNASNTSGTVHPPLCTDLTFAGTPNKMFENIAVPAARRNRWKFSNSHATVIATGTAYLYLSRGV